MLVIGTNQRGICAKTPSNTGQEISTTQEVNHCPVESVMEVMEVSLSKEMKLQ